MYITFNQYQELGGSLEQPEFIRQEFAARKEIDLHTFDRLQNINPVPEVLKMCTLELIQRELCGSLDGQDYTSQSSGKVSVTKETRNARAEEIIRRYLSGLTVDGIPVFYAGNI
ncbi:MAG: hypothetical protein FWB73_00890 [Treponema sp.]|nr:hypothetical protein [Treponema sp.]